MYARIRKLVPICAALLLGLLLCEGALRLVGVAYKVGSERDVRSAHELGPEGKTLVCLGDSNTFGIWVDAADSYPARLQDLLDEHVAGGPHRVVNLGVPGLNSRQVRKHLPAALDEYEPDAVLVLVGFNDSWAWTPDPDNNDIFVDPPWYESLRLVRLLRIATSRGAADPELQGAVLLDGMQSGTDRTGREFSFQPADYTAPRKFKYVLESLVRALETMCADAEAANTPLYLLTYAGGGQAYGLATRAARDVSAGRPTPLIDAGAWFETPGSVRRVDVLFPDGHPREPGYELFARLVFNGLIEHGALEAEPIEPLTRDLVSRPTPPVLTVRPDRSALIVRRERPGRRFAVYLSLSGEGPAPEVGALALPLVDDELFRRTRDDARMRGVIGPNGVGTVSIGHVLEDPSLAGRRLLAVSVSWGAADRAQPVVSEVVEIRVP